MLHVGAGAATAIVFVLLGLRWEMKALAENVEVEFDDTVLHLAVEQKAVFRNAITLVVNFNAHNTVKVEVGPPAAHALCRGLPPGGVHWPAAPSGAGPTRFMDELRGALDFLPPVFGLCVPESSSGGFLFVGDDTIVRKPCMSAWGTLRGCCHHHELLQHAGLGVQPGTSSLTPHDPACVQIDPCRLASLNESSFWIKSFENHPYKRGERENPEWSASPNSTAPLHTQHARMPVFTYLLTRLQGTYICVPWGATCMHVLACRTASRSACNKGIP